MKNQKLPVGPNLPFLDPCCLKPYIDDFVGNLALNGYTHLSKSNYFQSIAHFGTWLQKQGIAVAKIDKSVFNSFAKHQCNCPGGRRHRWVSRRYVARVREFLIYLDKLGIVDFHREKEKDCLPNLIVEFSNWLSSHRGITSRTISRNVRMINSLLPEIGSNPTQYDYACVRKAIETKIPLFHRSTVQLFASALRGFLRFLSSKGHCRPGLEAAVPTCPQWKLSALPRYLPAQDIERVVDSCDRKTTCGLRDRAILLLLSRLGLRAGDIVNMRFEDIEWDEGTLRVCGKGRREIRLPLPQDAGDAILEYLKKARPQVPMTQIFLCAQAPYRAFPSSVVVSNIVQAALARAEIMNPPSHGANLLRHSAATSMLRAGATLDAVSTVLRHRSLDSTAHYAKVDIVMLRTVVQLWPEGAPC